MPTWINNLSPTREEAIGKFWSASAKIAGQRPPRVGA
jgi:hypothetical protein